MQAYRLLVGINCSFSTDPLLRILNGSALEVTRLNWATGQTFPVSLRQVFEGQELLNIIRTSYSDSLPLSFLLGHYGC